MSRTNQSPVTAERPSFRQRITRSITSMSSKKRMMFVIIVAAVTLFVIIVLAANLYFNLRPKSSSNDSNGKSGKDSGDPDKPLPPSTSPLSVFSKAAVVSLGEPCSGIGKNMLEKGGSAADAAIATMLCVGAWVMQSMGIGGGFILTMYDQKTKSSRCLIARETAPAAAPKDLFENPPSYSGPHAAGVPGALKGYQELHEKFGRLPWKDLFQPTIDICEKGVIVNRRLAINFRLSSKLVENSPTIMNTILKELGRVPKEGEILKLPELAKTLRTVANSPNKADAFYKGELTKSFVEDVLEGGGYITEEDLNKYEVRWEETIDLKISGDRTVYTSAMPGAGILLGFLLRIMDGVVDSLSHIEHAHFLVEAFKHAIGHRSYLCDPNMVNRTVLDETLNRLNDEKYIKQTREKIKPFWTTDNASYYSDSGPYSKSGTDSLVVMDAEGLAISLTSSINNWFGSVFVSESTGILLNDHMRDFSIPSNAMMPLNYIEPGKRPISSMCPTVVVDSRGDVLLVVGGAGGTSIIPAVTQVAEYNLFLGKNIKQAIDEPRFYNPVNPNKIYYEYGIVKDVVKSWNKTGYAVERVSDYIGVVTGIARRGAELTANCDRRKYGSVDGY